MSDEGAVLDCNAVVAEYGDRFGYTDCCPGCHMEAEPDEADRDGLPYSPLCNGTLADGRAYLVCCTLLAELNDLGLVRS